MKNLGLIFLLIVEIIGIVILSWALGYAVLMIYILTELLK